MASELKEKPVIMKAESVRSILTGGKVQTRRVITRQNSRLWSRLDPPHREKVDEEFWDKLCWTGDDAEPDDDGLSVIYDWDGDGIWRCFKPTWEIGQLLWVREAFWASHDVESRDYAAPTDWGPHLSEDYYESGHESYIQYCAHPVNPKSPDEPGEFIHTNWDLESQQHWTPWEHYSKQSPLFMPKWASRLWLKVTGTRAERLNDMTISDALLEGMNSEPCTHPNREMYGCTDCMDTGMLEDPRWEFEHRWDEINGKRGFPWKSNPWVWVFTFETVPRPNLWPNRKVEE